MMISLSRFGSIRCASCGGKLGIGKIRLIPYVQCTQCNKKIFFRKGHESIVFVPATHDLKGGGNGDES